MSQPLSIPCKYHDEVTFEMIGSNLHLEIDGDATAFAAAVLDCSVTELIELLKELVNE